MLQLHQDLPLPQVYGNGFVAWVDAYAYPEPTEDDTSSPASRTHALVLLSLFGDKEAVRAICAYLLTGGTVQLYDGTSEHRCRLGLDGAGAWHCQQAALLDSRPTGQGRRRRLLHGLLIPKSALGLTDGPDTLLVIPPPPPPPGVSPVDQEPLAAPAEPADIAQRFYPHLADQLMLPLHPAWAPWLWQHLRAEGLVRPCHAVGVLVYECRLDPDRLTEIITAGCRAGVLPELPPPALAAPPG